MIEIPHNTLEQSREYLELALRIVADLDPPEDLRQICFAKAIDLVAAKTLQVAQPPPIGVPNLGVDRMNRPIRG